MSAISLIGILVLLLLAGGGTVTPLMLLGVVAVGLFGAAFQSFGP